MENINLAFIYNKLQDEESREIYDAKLRYHLTGEPFDLFELIYKGDKEFGGWDIERLSDSFYENKDLIIYGDTPYIQHTNYIIQHSRLKGHVVALCDVDKDKWDTEVDGLPVISPIDMYEKKDAVVIPATATYPNSLYENLVYNYFPKYNIFAPVWGRIIAAYGWQYFDMFTPRENEIFVDAGAYDGDTGIDFVKWCHNKYEKMYIFEPQKELTEVIKKRFASLSINKYEMFVNATWNEKTILRFNDRGGTSSEGCVCSDGNISIPTISIDEALDGRPATFIKMDIEGSELESLVGAQKTITKYHPRLAICIYHKGTDLIDIPKYILQLNPNYKLSIRHYTSDICETVLYAQE